MSELDALYQELILDHSKHPEGKGTFTPPDGTRTASHHEFNPSCGDEITLSIAVGAADTIEHLAWEGQGCAISMASASMLSQLVREHTLTLATASSRIDAFREMIHSRGATPPDETLLGDAVALRGVAQFVMRVKCAMLAWVALEATLAMVSAECLTRPNVTRSQH